MHAPCYGAPLTAIWHLSSQVGWLKLELNAMGTQSGGWLVGDFTHLLSHNANLQGRAW